MALTLVPPHTGQVDRVSLSSDGQMLCALMCASESLRSLLIN
jgi:hypothetical protein